MATYFSAFDFNFLAVSTKRFKKRPPLPNPSDRCRFPEYREFPLAPSRSSEKNFWSESFATTAHATSRRTNFWSCRRDETNFNWVTVLLSSIVAAAIDSFRENATRESILWQSPDSADKVNFGAKFFSGAPRWKTEDSAKVKLVLPVLIRRLKLSNIGLG